MLGLLYFNHFKSGIHYNIKNMKILNIYDLKILYNY
jgi:hypothetical protein